MTMEYVMVPVPEELVPDVQRLVSWRGTDVQPADLDEDALGRLLEGLDQAERRFLAAVARGVVDGDARSRSRLADELGHEPLEVFGLVLKLNRDLARTGGLQATVTLLPNPAGSDDEIVTVHPPMAELVLRCLGER